jgi:hypothetical protein
MKTFYNDRHALHHGRHEMFRGALVPCVEVLEGFARAG